MRRILAMLGLLVLCMFCQCKRPTPPDAARVARSVVILKEHQSL